MLTLLQVPMIRNHVISTGNQHHLDENFDIQVFGDDEIQTYVGKKLKNAVQKQVTGFFSRGKAVYIKMHRNASSTETSSPEDTLRKFIKLIKDGIFANPDSTRDLVGDKTIITVNMSENPEKEDTYYFAGFKLKS